MRPYPSAARERPPRRGAIGSTLAFLLFLEVHLGDEIDGGKREVRKSRPGRFELRRSEPTAQSVVEDQQDHAESQQECDPFVAGDGRFADAAGVVDGDLNDLRTQQDAEHHSPPQKSCH